MLYSACDAKDFRKALPDKWFCHFPEDPVARGHWPQKGLIGLNCFNGLTPEFAPMSKAREPVTSSESSSTSNDISPAASQPPPSQPASPRRRGKDKAPRQSSGPVTPEYPRKPDGRGFAVVKHHGKRYFLGEWGTQESYDRFADVFREVSNANLLAATSVGHREPATVNELIFHFLEYARDRYVKNGRQTSEYSLTRWIMKSLVEKYGKLVADDFTPLHLIEIRDDWKVRYARTSVIAAMARIRQMFKFGVSRMIVKAETLTRLAAVEGVREHQGIQSEPILPVPISVVEVTKKFVPLMVEAMIDLQRLTGMRPSEVVALHISDIEKLDDGMFVYSPRGHKTEHHGRERKVAIGPKAIEAIRKWYAEAAVRFSASGDVDDGYLFKVEKRRKKRGHCSVDWYRENIQRACRQAGVEEWAPNRLRHNAGTEVRKVFGIEVARTVLGHSSVDMTEIYAEKDLQSAIAAMAKIG